MRRTDAFHAEVLLRCAREHDWALPPTGLADLVRGRDLSGLARAADEHGVIGCAHRSFLAMLGPRHPLVSSLGERAAMATASHMNALADLAWAGPILRAADTPWLVMKGPVLAESVYPFPDLRAYADLDILVPPSAFGRAVRALEDAGARVLDRNWRLVREQMRGQLHLVLPFGTVCDLHWDLVNTERASFTTSIEELVDRRRPVELGNIVVDTLDAEDTILHLALHACLAGGDRIVWLKDIDLAARAQPDWDVVTSRADGWKVGPLVATTLGRAERFLSAPVPRGVLVALAGRAGRVARMMIDRLSPPGRPGRLSLARIGSRTAGRGLGQSSRMGVRHIGNAFSRRPADSHPSGILEGRGGEADRDAYLAAVSAQAVEPARREARRKKH